MLSHMKWAHLPEPGGFYEQSPVLMDRFEIIFTEIDKHEAEEQKKRDKEAEDMKRKNRAGRLGRAR